MAFRQSDIEEALDFLGKLADRFVAGDRSRVVVPPGNHDLSRPPLREMPAAGGESRTHDAHKCLSLSRVYGLKVIRKPRFGFTSPSCPQLAPVLIALSPFQFEREPISGRHHVTVVPWK